MTSCLACERPARSRGYCNRHYENLRRYGDPIPQRDKPIMWRLEKVGWDVTETGCWTWKGQCHAHGYGLYNHQRVHRIMYEQKFGPIPDDLMIRHTCDNPPCVNPDHLLLGTMADNMGDMVERGRHYLHGATHCRLGHEYAAQRRTPPGGARRCWECYQSWCLRHGRKVAA